MSSSDPPRQRPLWTFPHRLALIVATAVLAAVLWNAPTLPFLLLAAILVALLLDAAAGLFGKKLATRVGRAVTVALAALSLTGIAAGGVALLGPELSAQADVVQQRLPQAVEKVRAELSEFAIGRAIVERTPTSAEVDDALNGEDTTSNVPVAIEPTSKSDSDGLDLASLFRSTFGFLVDLLVVLVLGIYLALRPQDYIGGLLRLIPPGDREQIRETLDEMGTLLKRWLLARLVSMVVTAGLTALALEIAGVPFALTLGVIAGLLSFIPNLGPVLGMAPGVLMAMLEGGSNLALITVALYLGVQLVESYVVTPLVERRAVSLPAGLLIFMQLVLGVLFGGLGLVLATPLTVVAITLIRRLYVERSLESGPPDILISTHST